MKHLACRPPGRAWRSSIVAGRFTLSEEAYGSIDAAAGGDRVRRQRGRRLAFAQTAQEKFQGDRSTKTIEAFTGLNRQQAARAESAVSGARRKRRTHRALGRPAARVAGQEALKNDDVLWRADVAEAGR